MKYLCCCSIKSLFRTAIRSIGSLRRNDESKVHKNVIQTASRLFHIQYRNLQYEVLKTTELQTTELHNET